MRPVVLVAADDAAIRSRIAGALRVLSAFWRVEAVNANSCLARALQNDVEVVILALPAISVDPNSICREVKATSNSCTIFVLHGDLPLGEWDRAVAAGVDDVLDLDMDEANIRARVWLPFSIRKLPRPDWQEGSPPDPGSRGDTR